jgi:hypothetical protein
MFCFIYFPNNGDKKLNPEVPIQPNVLEISQSRNALLKSMEDKAIQQCIDEVGRKNFINTMDQKEELDTISYPIYPTLAATKVCENMIQVYRIEKKQVVLKGYLYNSIQDTVESSLYGTYYVLPIGSWKYEDLPRRPEEEKQKIMKPVETNTSVDMIKNYDKVLLQLIESIQKRKLD